MRVTRIVGSYTTRAEAEQAREWAARTYRTLPLKVKRHGCAKARPQRAQWLLLSVVEVPDTDAASGNGKHVS